MKPVTIHRSLHTIATIWLKERNARAIYRFRHIWEIVQHTIVCRCLAIFCIHTTMCTITPDEKKADRTPENGKALGGGVISKIDEPTEWCSPMVVVLNANGKVRICLDLTKQVCETWTPHITHSWPPAGPVRGGKGQERTNSGYWKIPLSSKSRALMTFISHFGR